MTGQLNVNQFALPGMEEHAHAGAAHLAQGRGFRYKHEPKDEWNSAPQHTLEMLGPGDPAMEGQRPVRVARLAWLDSSHPVDPDMHGYNPYAGEIQGINTREAYQRQGVASALYGMAMDPKVHTGNDTLPLHSPERTHRGLAWSKAVGGWDPDKDEAEQRPRHPFERDVRVEDRRPPEVPGQQRMWG